MHVNLLGHDVLQDYDRKLSALVALAFVSDNGRLSNRSSFGVRMFTP
jgi:hypothetical protein